MPPIDVRALHIELGPLSLDFWPDGDDPGVGQIAATYDGSQLPIGGVTRYDWNRIVKAAER
jgi:hypothetical protein